MTGLPPLTGVWVDPCGFWSAARRDKSATQRNRTDERQHRLGSYLDCRLRGAIECMPYTSKPAHKQTELRHERCLKR